MPEVVEEFGVGVHMVAGASKYEKFANGQIWKITTEDLPSVHSATLKMFAGGFGQYCRNRSKSSRTQMHADYVLVQMLDAPEKKNPVDSTNTDQIQ